MTVLIQPMVQGVKFAGVMFTGDPANGDRDTTVIEYVRGLADKLVGGEVAPEQTLRLQAHSIITGGSDLSHFLAELRQAAPRIEAAFSYKPVDTEWAVDSDNCLYWLQARSITGVEWQRGKMTGLGIGEQVVEGTVYRADDDSGKEMPDGSILVTRMTSPRMIMAMVKATAIITEIGGELCHAAIVGRDLHKPTIVGCKQAATLKTGQRIRVMPATGRIEVLDEM